MPIEPTTVFFEDYFAATSPLDNYDPYYHSPSDTAGLSDDRFEIRRGEGPADEDFLRWVAPSYNCPGCTVDCGTPDADCRYSRQAVRRANSGSQNVWRHLRCYVRPHGVWDPVYDYANCVSFVINNPSGVIGENPWVYFIAGIEWDGTNWALGIIHAGFNHAPQVSIPVAFDEWTCIEMARRYTDSVGNVGDVKAWVNDVLVLEDSWSHNGQFWGFQTSRGFAIGPWSGGPAGPDKWVDFARISWADGPIGCGSRAGLPPDENPVDPDAFRCQSADDYAGADEISGECGRAICQTGGKTREAWETFGAGFPSEQSFWYRWVAPRSGRFIFRTRGSEVFNEVGVYRHTGATPPPLLPGGFADEDPWDPIATTSSAVEVEVESGVEYRIRVASASDGWAVLDFGPAKPLVQDDGWSINESERETRTRVAAVGTVSGLAVEDDQVAAASNGAGALPTLDGILFGDLGV